MVRLFDYRVLFVAISTVLAVITPAENISVDAKIIQVTERGYILKSGTETIPVEDDQKTKFWIAKNPGTRESFKVGDAITVKIKTDASPALVREMSDPATAKWLEHLRRDDVPAVILKVDLKRILVSFDDKSTFSYAHSAKTKVEINGGPSSVSELKEGTKVYVKAQLMPSLDTRATLIADKLTVASKTTKGGTKVAAKRSLKLPEVGFITGVVTAIQEPLSIFDIETSGNFLHITCNSQSRIMIVGSPALLKMNALRTGETVDVNFRRDKYGRIVAAKVMIHRT